MITNDPERILACPAPNSRGILGAAGEHGGGFVEVLEYFQHVFSGRVLGPEVFRVNFSGSADAFVGIFLIAHE